MSLLKMVVCICGRALIKTLYGIISTHLAKIILLTRGQTVPDVKEDETVPIELKPGQLSLHHPRVIHGSGQNTSKKRRIGFAIQSYIGADVDQVIGKIYVQQARGEDPFSYHEHTERPTATLTDQDIQFRDQANDALSDIFYHGAKARKY